MTHDETHPIERDDHQRVVDPSDAVTGLGFVLGLAGAAAGVVTVLVISGPLVAATVLYCLIGALAGGSAGVVTGGMIGAIFSVARGRPH